MKTYGTRTRAGKTKESPSRARETAVAQFETREEAWAFMRRSDDNGVSAGFPSLKAPYTVEYSK